MRSTPEPTSSATRTLDRPEGRIGFDVQGEGPLVVCAPGMGDLRSVYRFVVPDLVDAGYRVATMDLRGHGDSDTGFSRYDDVATGTDLLALIEELGGPAVIVGNSMSAGSAVWAAVEAPDRVSGLVLLGPFVRNVPVGRMQMAALRLGLLRPWGPAVWNGYYAKLYPGRPPADLDSHRARIRASLARPDHWRAFIATTHTSHAPVEERVGSVQVPTLVVMGTGDPDFPDPEAEARSIAEATGGEALLVTDAGHYPQAEYPEVVLPAMLDLLDKATRRA